MIDSLILLQSLVIGIFLGLMFFGGLWWTVQKGLSSHRQVLWFITSLMLRFGITLIGFYLTGRSHWQNFLICLLGFTIARAFVHRISRHLGKSVAIHAP